MLSPPVLSSLRERWLYHRNRTLADPGFQRFAARFLLTRPVARRRARGLFDLVAGFTYSQIVVACVESGLLERLAGKPLGIDEIGERIGLDLQAAERLLRAAAALDLTERLGDRWTLGSAGAALRGNRGIAEMVAHHRLLYADLADPLALLRRGGGGALADYWDYAGTGEGAAGYSALMAASQALIADQVIDAYDFSRHARVLDAGGGEGAFAAALARRVPSADVTVFDLPEVAARAQAKGVGAIGGDFTRDSLPRGFDAITLVRVLHDHDDSPALALLRAIHAALPDGGRLVLAEPMAATRGAAPAGDAYFGMYLLAMGSGRPRTVGAICAMLKVAGFARYRERATALPMTCRVLVAER